MVGGLSSAVMYYFLWRFQTKANRKNNVAVNIIQVTAIDLENKGAGTTPAEIIAVVQYLFSVVLKK